MRARIAYAALVLRAIYDLARYDTLHAVRGFGFIQARLVRQSPRQGMAADAACERAVCDAVLLATCLYWKPVLCLQRSVCAARMLRARGVPARVVVGYRELPFFSHAWVEVGSRVVNDSPVYQKRLRVLHSM